jgi:dipeptidyl aminopeptidase/acylaminoacyl peptidase
MSSVYPPTTRAGWIAAGRREPIMFENDGQAVLGVIHRPRRPPAARLPAVAIFHGFVGSKDQPHQIFVKLAEALAAAGVVALRIDFRGRGDSEGDTVDITFEGDMADARGALDLLAAQPDVDAARLGVVGMSWGVTIAACLAGRDRRVGSTVLWSGAAEVHNWNPPMREVEGRQVFEMFCNLVGKQFYDSLREVYPLEIVKAARGPVLIAHGTADEDVPIENTQRFRDALAAAGIAHELALIEGADHVFMRHEWERELIERSVAWLVRTL